MNFFLDQLKRFGFSCNKEKIINPDTRVKYLGIEIDSTSMTLSLPAAKLVVLQDLIFLFNHKRVVTKRELQQLAGNLSHCSTIIKAGKTFSRRVINLIKYFPTNRKVVKLSNEFYADLSWWSSFAKMFNGTGLIIKQANIDMIIYTDASGLGFGGFVEVPYDYFYGTWSHTFSFPCAHYERGPMFDVVNDSIAQKELWPVLVACKRLSTSLSGKNVLVYTDNQSVRSMINTGRSKDIHAMSMLREIFWVCFVFKFSLSSKYIKGLDNIKADFLSRISSFSHSFLMSNDLFISMSPCCRRSVLTKFSE